MNVLVTINLHKNCKSSVPYPIIVKKYSDCLGLDWFTYSPKLSLICKYTSFCAFEGKQIHSQMFHVNTSALVFFMISLKS